MAYFGRGPNKIQSPYVVKDFYKAYIADKDADSPYNIPYIQFSRVVRSYYKSMSDHLLDGGLLILPFKMGTVAVVKYRPRKFTAVNLPIDWENTVKYGKVIRHTNDHSNYFKFIYNWNRATCKVTNKTLYRLIPVRAFKRALAAKIKSGEHSYFEL